MTGKNNFLSYSIISFMVFVGSFKKLLDAEFLSVRIVVNDKNGGTWGI